MYTFLPNYKIRNTVSKYSVNLVLILLINNTTTIRAVRADLQQEVDKQMAVLEGERSALQMKTDEFQSRNQRERDELELAGKELKRSAKAFEDGRKTWEREKKSETQYIENLKQELEVGDKRIKA